VVGSVLFQYLHVMKPKNDKAKLAIIKLSRVNQLGTSIDQPVAEPCFGDMNNRYSLSYDNETIDCQSL
jgi:hypothetical protein